MRRDFVDIARDCTRFDARCKVALVLDVNQFGPIETSEAFKKPAQDAVQRRNIAMSHWANLIHVCEFSCGLKGQHIPAQRLCFFSRGNEEF